MVSPTSKKLHMTRKIPRDPTYSTSLTRSAFSWQSIHLHPLLRRSQNETETLQGSCFLLLSAFTWMRWGNSLWGKNEFVAPRETCSECFLFSFFPLIPSMLPWHKGSKTQESLLLKKSQNSLTRTTRKSPFLFQNLDREWNNFYGSDG